jgi:hypothetical protein
MENNAYSGYYLVGLNIEPARLDSTETLVKITLESTR